MMLVTKTTKDVAYRVAKKHTISKQTTAGSLPLRKAAGDSNYRGSTASTLRYHGPLKFQTSYHGNN